MRKDKVIHAKPHPLGYVSSNNRKITISRRKTAEQIQSIPIFKLDPEKSGKGKLLGYRYIYHDSIASQLNYDYNSKNNS